jgi:hypothetical protein
LLTGILIVFIGHFFGKWFATAPETKSSFLQEQYLPIDSKVARYQLECPFDEVHFFDGNGATFKDVIGGHFSSVKLSGIISGTFEKHWKIIFLLGFIAALVIYILGKVRFTIIKDKEGIKQINS